MSDLDIPSSLGGVRGLTVPDNIFPRNTPQWYGPMVREPQETIQINRRATTSGGGTFTLAGAFYTLYVDGSGDTYLQGGQVKVGTGTPDVIADLKVIDHISGITESNGDKLVLEVTLTGYVEDGVLLGGLTSTAAAYITPSVATIPADTLPTVSSFTGRKCYIEIGRWAADKFFPSNLGNIRISFCGTGDYSVTRF